MTTEAGPKIACPATHLLHEEDERENFIMTPGTDRARFTCIVCGLRWSISNPQLRRMIVLYEVKRACDTDDADAMAAGNFVWPEGAA